MASFPKSSQALTSKVDSSLSFKQTSKQQPISQKSLNSSQSTTLKISRTYLALVQEMTFFLVPIRCILISQTLKDSQNSLTAHTWIHFAFHHFEDVPNPRNIFWAEYYQKVMKIAKTMTFVITAAWLGSKNCWEELGWAADCRQDATKFTTIFVFTNVAYYHQLETEQTFIFKFGTETRTFNWNELKRKLGFTVPAIYATTVDEVRDKVNKRRLRARTTPGTKPK